jgi:hypothetical protein
MTDKLTEWKVSCARSPGLRWRVRAYGDDGEFEVEDRGKFDELVVDHWLHVEQMDDRLWIVRVGDRGFLVDVKKNGTVDVEEQG